MRPRRQTALIAALAVLGYAGVKGRLRRYEIAERSMEPTLQSGDYVLAQALRSIPTRGDIVIFDHPALPDLELVKRVVGLPGERIVIGNGQIHANEAVLAEPWADGPTRPDGRWELGADEVFVLGDNRSASAADSRTLGPIPLWQTKWRVVARYWPPTSMGRLTR